eukprot:g741.t1
MWTIGADCTVIRSASIIQRLHGMTKIRWYVLIHLWLSAAWVVVFFFVLVLYRPNLCQSSGCISVMRFFLLMPWVASLAALLYIVLGSNALPNDQDLLSERVTLAALKSVSMAAILHGKAAPPFTREAFRSWLVQEFPRGLAHFNYWTAVQEVLVQISALDFVHTHEVLPAVHAINDRFFSEGSPDYVNIRPAYLEEILRAMERLENLVERSGGLSQSRSGQQQRQHTPALSPKSENNANNNNGNAPGAEMTPTLEQVPSPHASTRAVRLSSPNRDKAGFNGSGSLEREAAEEKETADKGLRISTTLGASALSGFLPSFNETPSSSRVQTNAAKDEVVTGTRSPGARKLSETTLPCSNSTTVSTTCAKIQRSPKLETKRYDAALFQTAQRSPKLTHSQISSIPPGVNSSHNPYYITRAAVVRVETPPGLLA